MYAGEDLDDLRRPEVVEDIREQHDVPAAAEIVASQIAFAVLDEIGQPFARGQLTGARHRGRQIDHGRPHGRMPTADRRAEQAV